MGRAVATLGVVAVFAAGVGLGASLGGAPSGDAADAGSALPDDLELAGALSSFDACEDYLAHVREHALEVVTPYGLHHGPGGRWGPAPFAADDGERAVAEDASGATEQAGPAPTPSAGTTPDDVSGTNVQEHGVDEPDRLKTDGEVAYTTVSGRLRILDVTGDDPRELASLDLDGDWGAELLLADDQLLVTSGGGPVIPFAGETLGDGGFGVGPGASTTTITSVDVSDPSAPVVSERLILDGAALSARMVDGVARVVIRTEPGVDLPWTHPETGGLRAEREALAENRRLIEESEAADWLPYVVHQTADGEESEGLLLDCRQVARPSEFAGLGTLSVLTIDVGDGRLVPDDGTVGVLAGGETVYASPGALYVATQRYVDPAVLEEAVRSDARPAEVEDVTTEIHAFDIGDPSSTRYLASGEVPGVLLDQWALSEHDGVLRVASTIGDRWWGGGEDSSSLVTTLERDGDRLAEIGQVGDLGPTERIYAVRFIGDVGYVVTFRQIDPLYVLDLSDPSAPRVTGELKIPGYSAYLHPVGEDLLVGVGQDADEETGRPLGTQVSLFDVADPADPRRIDTLLVEESHSDVEHDHRALLHWPATGLTVVPLVRSWHGEDGPPGGPPNGALAFTAGRDGFRPVGAGKADELALTHAEDAGDAADAEVGAPERPEPDAWYGQHGAAIQRSLVTGDRLLTFSERGVVTHDLEDLTTRGRLEHRASPPS
jgi:hypothetical protein